MTDDARDQAWATLVVRHGRPLVVLLDIEEFVRLKVAAGEPVPHQVLLVGPQIVRGHREYPMEPVPRLVQLARERLRMDVAGFCRLKAAAGEPFGKPHDR